MYYYKLLQESNLTVYMVAMVYVSQSRTTAGCTSLLNRNYLFYKSVWSVIILEHNLNFYCQPVFNFARAVQNPPVMDFRYKGEL